MIAISYLICGILKEMIQMNLQTNQKQTDRLGEGAYDCRVGERWGERIVGSLGWARTCRYI